MRGDAAAVRASGLAAFEAELTRYLTQRHDTDLVRSIADRAARLAGGIADEAEATLAGLALSGADLHRRITAFTDRLVEVERARVESAALAGAELDRLLVETNDQAAALGAGATAPLQRAVLAHLDGLAGPLGAAEQSALDFAAARIREVVGAWRERRSAELDAAVRALDERLAGRLDDHISTVRHTAATLFDLELVALPPAGRLVESTRFSYLRRRSRPGRGARGRHPQSPAWRAGTPPGGRACRRPGGAAARPPAGPGAGRFPGPTGRDPPGAAADLGGPLRRWRRPDRRGGAPGWRTAGRTQWNCRHGAGGDGGPPRCSGNAVRAAAPGRGA